MPKRIRIRSDRRIHFVTFGVYKHIPVFKSKICAEEFLLNLRHYCDGEKCLLHGYVIMPDHIHLLVEVDSSANISDLIRDIKKYFTHLVRTRLCDKLPVNINSFRQNDTFQFWERGFDEVTISSDKIFWVKLKYLHNNPVKAGIVSKAEDYGFSSARGYLMKSDEDPVGLRTRRAQRRRGGEV